MFKYYSYVILIILLSVFLKSIHCQEVISKHEVSISIQMPNISPSYPDSYICHKIELNQTRPVYITEFQPNIPKNTAHHVLLFTCAETVEYDTWDCGEMYRSGKIKTKFNRGPICYNEEKIIFAWAKDANSLVLPKDVAFKIGGDLSTKYLILQVHYANVDKFINGKQTDRSGLTLMGQYEQIKYLAGVFYTLTDGRMKPKSKENFEAACTYNYDIDIFPFAYRVHAHKHGLVNSGYVVREDPTTKEQKWIEIGRQSPQLPQTFYPVTNNISITKGDIIASRCTMENTEDHYVSIGQTNDDEMCNFYIMYYVKDASPLKEDESFCFTQGPPNWYFQDFDGEDFRTLNLEKMPKEISDIPGENQ